MTKIGQSTTVTEKDASFIIRVRLIRGVYIQMIPSLWDQTTTKLIAIASQVS